MYTVYILKSQLLDRYYIGLSGDINSRIKCHNSSRVRSTKSYVPWILIHSESFATRQKAYARELQIKSYKNGEAFKKLIMPT